MHTERQSQKPQNPSSERFSMFGTTFHGDKIVLSPADLDARQLIIRSFIIAPVSFLLATGLLVLNEVGVVTSLALAGFFTYIAWTSYWGIVGIVRGWKEPKCGEPIEDLDLRDTILQMLGLLIVAPFVIGILYGLLGGGIREFLYYRRLAGKSAVPQK